jgi:hypothetical protein
MVRAAAAAMRARISWLRERVPWRNPVWRLPFRPTPAIQS